MMIVSTPVSKSRVGSSDRAKGEKELLVGLSFFVDLAEGRREGSAAEEGGGKTQATESSSFL